MQKMMEAILEITKKKELRLIKIFPNISILFLRWMFLNLTIRRLKKKYCNTALKAKKIILITIVETDMANWNLDNLMYLFDFLKTFTVSSP